MSEEDDSMSEIEEQEQKENGGGLDYIMSLESVPSKLPPHLELLRTRVLCNNDAPQHVSIISFAFYPLNFTFFFVHVWCVSFAFLLFILLSTQFRKVSNFTIGGRGSING